MTINDDYQIELIGADTLLDEEFIAEIYSNNSVKDRLELLGFCRKRAKELGFLKDFNEIEKTVKAQYYRYEAEKRGGIMLERSENGKPLATIKNFLTVLLEDKYFENIQFNALTLSAEKIVDDNRITWSDVDDADVRNFIEKTYHFHNESKLNDALRLFFKQREYHPIKDIIESIEWDGTSRINDFLHTWTKCEDTPYTREVSRLIFAGGINRLYNPGCKFEDMPVLIGTKQGEGKTTLVRWLALEDEFFATVGEFEGQRAIEALQGAWICEVGEMIAVTKPSEVETVKEFLSRQVDRYRKPYDRHLSSCPRQCIFIGTGNKEQFLTDKTGNRRFYPIKVNQDGYELGKKEQEARNYIKQCWAEAKALFDKNEIQPYAKQELVEIIRAEQANAVEDDYRIGMIERYIAGKDEVCGIELWINALNGEQVRFTKRDSAEIALIMSKMEGWERMPKAKRFPAFGLQRYWKKTDISADDIPF